MPDGLILAEHRAEVWSSLFAKYDWAIVGVDGDFFVVAENGLGLFSSGEVLSVWRGGIRV